MRTAIALARSQGASLQLVHVFDDHDLARIPNHLGYDPESARRQAMTATEADFDDAADLRRAAGIPFASELTEGDVVRELLSATSRLNARLNATGTHGRNVFGRLVLGSVARVCCESPVPALTVRS